MHKNNCKVISTCETSLKILSKYYSIEYENNLSHYLIPPSSKVHEKSGQVLFEEDSVNDELFIGIQFGKEIYGELERNYYISLQSMTVIAEEISHFKLISDTAHQKGKISILEIEMMGEIDKFLSLMHWNNECSEHKINEKWKNLHQICDAVFTGNRFKDTNMSLYIKAEELAFKHLKTAFSEFWDSTYFDFQKVSLQAKKYLSELRKNVIT